MEIKGLVHKYLGTWYTIAYFLPEMVVFAMFDFPGDIIAEAPDDLKKSHSYYPGINNDHLLKVGENSNQLLPKKAELFHWIVAHTAIICLIF